MDDNKEGIGCYVTLVITLMIIGVAIKFMVDFPILWAIIGVVVLIIVGYLIYTIYNSTGDRYMKWKFGEDFQKAIDSGQLSLHEAYPCVPESQYTTKKGIEDECGLELPDFAIKECKETLPDFTGDYCGSADIVFDVPIDDNIIMQIEEDMKHSHSKWERWKGDSGYLCHLIEPNLDVKPSQDVFWRLVIRKGSSKGEIVYGRI